jgi:hypothetical protein
LSREREKKGGTNVSFSTDFPMKSAGKIPFLLCAFESLVTKALLGIFPIGIESSPFFPLKNHPIERGH